MSDYLAKPKSAPRGGVLILHAWWGLNDFFKNLCEKLASEGYVTLASDLYNGATARTIPEADKLRKTVKRDAASAHILDSLKQLQSEVHGKSIATIGFSMGAFWSLWLAEEKPKTIAATILFYGSRGGEYASTRSAFLGHFAETDEYVSDSSKKKLEKVLKVEGKDVSFFTYSDTHHWFFENDRPEFNPRAATLAWERTMEFLGKRLG